MSNFYLALIDGEPGAFGVAFPDLPGCTAMGDSVEEAMANASEALRDWFEAETAAGRASPIASTADQLLSREDIRDEISQGAALAHILLVRRLGRLTKANVSMDSGILAAVDAAADRLRITRSALIERIAEEGIGAYA